MDDLSPVPELDSSARRPRLVVIGLLLVAVAAVVLAVAVVAALTSDDTVKTEGEVRAVIDSQFERVPEPSWCDGGCSASDDEWHAPLDAEAVAARLVELLTDAGLTAEYTPGAPDAYLVKIEEGNGLDIGVTGPAWDRASDAATGTAIWFTSVSIFDE